MTLRKKLVFSLVCVTLACVIAELTLVLLFPQKRWFEYVSADGTVVSFTSVPWGITPHGAHRHFSPEFGEITLRTNADGIVDHDDHKKEKPPGVIRILLLGDSFTMGWGSPYETTYSRLAERTLQRIWGSDKIEFIKAGVAGYDIQKEVNAFQIKWAEYGPDIVVVGLLYHDLKSATRSRSLDIEGTSAEADQAGSPGAWGSVYRAVRHSHVVSGITRLMLANDTLFCSLYLRYPGGEKRNIAYFQKPFIELVERDFSAAVEQLHALKKGCDRIGAELHVMFIAQRIQVVLARRPIDGIDPYLPQRRLEEDLKAKGIEMFDTLPALSEFPPTATFWTFDHHLTPSGNEIVARELLVHLLTRSARLRTGASVGG